MAVAALGPEDEKAGGLGLGGAKKPAGSWSAGSELRAFLRIVIDAEGRPLVTPLESESPARFGLEVDARGVATRGILLRHLVMPKGLADTRAALTFLRDEISPNTYVNIMAQYRPAGRVGPGSFEEIGRPITAAEFEQAFADAAEAGLSRFDQRLRF